MADNSDTKRESKTRKLKDRIIILERNVEQMTDALCQLGEKVEQMDIDMDKKKCGFNESIREFQETTNVMIDTLNNEIHDRLKEAKDTLSPVTQRLKDQDDTIAMLK